MTPEFNAVLSAFKIDGAAISCEAYGAGHINQTKLVQTNTGKRYILQKISESAFPNVEGLMSNIAQVTEYLAAKNDDPRASMHLVHTKDDATWIRTEQGCWRMYDFVEDTICLQAAESPADFYESAVGFGRFQTQLADFPADNLCEIIKNFHNTGDRYRIFKETIAKDPLGRVKDIQKEIDYALSVEPEVTGLSKMKESGQLPTRVTHNDTKLNNVLLDAETRKALCVIDLDTVMPGLAAYDFGDSIRFGAATAAEDELDLDKMTIDLDLYKTFADGFVGQCKALTKDEIMSFPLGAKAMTMECGVRFLTDYIDGDHYFGIHREKHNLDRARTQFRMVSEMNKKWDEMRRIIDQFI